VANKVRYMSEAASSTGGLGKAQVSVADLGVSVGLMGHTGRLLMSRQLIIDVHTTCFILAMQYNVWSNAT